MERKIITTKDGSHTISIPEMNITYHSLHGAIQESEHVFIDVGLKNVRLPEVAGHINIFEIGFGTGLNALLTLIEAAKLQQHIHYTTIELFPLDKEEARSLNYCGLLSRPDLQPVFEQLHQCEWEKEISVNPFFTLHKIKSSLLRFKPGKLFNLVYFDAFSPTEQPELWTKEVFEQLYAVMSAGGIVVTYCSKADVRRAMQASGFIIEKIPGPWGKREMVRAVRPAN